MDPRLERLRQTLSLRPPLQLPRRPEQREAGVALLLRPREDIELLLIRRAELDGDPWSGHVALPGGRRAPCDLDLLGTAQRETEEEVGVPLVVAGTLIGALDELAPSTPLLPPILIAPFVVAVPPETEAAPSSAEVQATVWVPLDALRDERAASHIIIELERDRMRFPALEYGDYVVWGLTYRILQQFMELTT